MRRATTIRHRSMLLGLATMVLLLGPAIAADVNPAAITITPPDKIKWVAGDNGADTANLVGDPDKPGMYVIMVRWHAHHMSRPHFHPYDRYITVLSGTWWVGTGTKYDPDSTVPVQPGSFVTHIAKGIHYDGAKDADTVIEIVGQGPATATPAEVK
jgi:hypothetical protein